MKNQQKYFTKVIKNILLTTSSKFELQTRYEPRTRGHSYKRILVQDVRDEMCW